MHNGGAQDAPSGLVDDGGAPALQTSGLALMRSGQADALTSDVAMAQTHESDRSAGRWASLNAEDLVRGYRVDQAVSARLPLRARSEPAWMSLHQRVGDFAFKREGAGILKVSGVEDEGCVQPVVAQDVGGGVFYIHEIYAHWQGW